MSKDYKFDITKEYFYKIADPYTRRVFYCLGNNTKKWSAYKKRYLQNAT